MIKKGMLLAAILLLTSQHTMAARCYDDVEEMIQVMNQEGSFQTTNGLAIQDVVNEVLTSHNRCQADCYHYSTVLTCTWELGNWGETIYARKK